LFKGVSKFGFKDNYGLEKGLHIGTLLKKNLDDVMSEDDKEKQQSCEQMNESYTIENLPIKRAVFIDSTWNQCRGIYKDPRINSIKSCIIQSRVTKFWRNQKGSPKWYLATIEAIHQFLLEFHINAWGISERYYNECLNDLELDVNFISPSKILPDKEDDEDDRNNLTRPYNGQYDNLLYFFAFLHSLIHSLDDVNGKLNIFRPEEADQS
jgi:hypothetical protein